MVFTAGRDATGARRRCRAVVPCSPALVSCYGRVRANCCLSPWLVGRWYPTFREWLFMRRFVAAPPNLIRFKCDNPSPEGLESFLTSNGLNGRLTDIP